ncbi:MAG: DEAD/DEAH box helicase [Planctomycetota bacterium]
MTPPEPQDDAVDSTDDNTPAQNADPAAPPGAEFAALGLHARLVEQLVAGGYQSPTPIQQQAIPQLMAGHDLVGQAQTGTGKTAAFALPIVQRLDIGQRKVQALILCPTRELALQVTAAISSYGAARNVKVLTVYGGAPIYKQMSQLHSGVHVVVGTPGRVKDCIARGALKLNAVRQVVLDEADEMLRMGFIEDVEAIVSQVPQERQTALFSATMPPAIQRVATQYLRDPVRVTIEQRTRTVDRIEQRVLIAPAGDKLNVLSRLIESEPTDAVLVFARTRASCAHLVEALRARGVAGDALHGDLSQDQREQIVARLRARSIQLVVATDIAARGLDVEGITHVINFDPPSEPEVYVHRIGRTGRAGRTGVSILLLTPKERRVRRVIEGYTGQQMTAMKIPSNAELLAGRIARFQARVQETIEKGGLDPYETAIDQMVEESGADLRGIASALARMASKDHPLQISEPEPTVVRDGGTVVRDRGKGARLQGGTVRLFLALGRSAGLCPADIVGAIANEAKVPGRAVGAIDIREKVTFVDVAAEHAGAILKRLGKATLRGRSASFVVARPGSYERGHGKTPQRRPGGPASKRHLAAKRGPARGGAPKGGAKHAAAKPNAPKSRATLGGMGAANKARDNAGPKGAAESDQPPWRKYGKKKKKF